MSGGGGAAVPPAWGRWGPEDEAGALNLIGEPQVRAAAALVTRGRVIRLGRDLGPRTPVAPHRRGPERFMTRDGGDYASGARRPDGFQFAEEVFSFAPHTGTHVDALAHAWYGDQLYNGFSSHLTRSTSGAQRCGADKLRPIVTRGVLLDMLAGGGGPFEEAHPFTAADLQGAARAAGVILGTGDAVLIHTGWFRLAGHDPRRYFGGEPGLDLSAAEWLVREGVAVIGADTYAVEAQPSPPGTTFPVHQFLLRDQGVPLIEDLALDELVAAGRHTFLFVAAPLPLVGGTAGPVCPVAVL